ncbi:MAG: transporter substrate-binding domain-containing protein [Bermanella sp.]
MRLLFISIISFLMASTSAVYAQSLELKPIQRKFIKSISVVAPEWENYTNTNGSGLYWDIVRAIYEPVGIKVKTRNAPWNRSMKLVSKYHTYNAILGEYLETEEALIFPKYPIDVEYLTVFHKAQDSWTGLADFSGKKVGWLKDYDLIEEEVRNFKLMEFRHIDRGMEMLTEGEIDFLIDEEDEVLAAMERNKVAPENYVLDEMPEGTDVYMAFAVDRLSKELISIYNERLPILMKSGEMIKIYQKWDDAEIPAALSLLSE